jgi:DNA topoisomerase VI subunit B
MGNKRPHPDAESWGHGSEDGTRKRPKTNRPHKPRPKPVDHDSMTAIKKRARAIERLLARDNLKLPANKQNDLERELAAHKQRIEDFRAKKERSKMIQKYHMVRFFGMAHHTPHLANWKEDS